MLRIWATLTPEDALDLLDAGFADSSIRSYAVQCLTNISDDKLISYLLQLVQVRRSCLVLLLRRERPRLYLVPSSLATDSLLSS